MRTQSIIALTDFQSILPAVVLSQDATLEYIAKVHEDTVSDSNQKTELKARVMKYGIRSSKIATRGFESIEIAATGADIQERTKFFLKAGRKVFAKFYPAKIAKAPEHIVHVTCTGYISPSPAQCLVNDNDWLEKTSVTHAYHMGCYASLPAVRMAEGLVAALKSPEGKNVDIVHTEMCGLHLNPNAHSPEQLVVQSLFADGHIKYSAVPVAEAKNGFEVLNICEQIVKDSQDDMSWIPATYGMQMTLSREVPQKIGSSLRPFLTRLLLGTDMQLGDVLKNAVFAVHPGGPKIIEAVAEVLELREEQVIASKHILLTHGNMSSATLPHVWELLLKQNIPSGQIVVSLAFGPGLTIFGALFRVI
jgi:predicted naringenin-chalcone synthase